MCRRRLSELFALLAVLVAPALANATTPEYQLLDSVVRVSTTEPEFLSKSILDSVNEIRVDIANGRSTDWKKGLLISALVKEAEFQLVGSPASAIKRIELGLAAAEIWRNDFNHWNSSVLIDEGRALLMRWFLKGNPVDQVSAAKKFEASDDQAQTESKGHGVYQHGGAYETLASKAGRMERPREEQIALLAKGIEVNKAGRKKYPAYDYGVSLDALYGKFEVVSGGSALGAYIEEWLAFLATEPKSEQSRAGISVAAALFTLRRDSEALVWANRYIDWQKESIAGMKDEALKRLLVSQACGPGSSFNLFFGSLIARDPAMFLDLKTRHCQALRSAR